MSEPSGGPERVLLIGMMGAGKSTVGQLLADRLGRPYIDSDDEVQRRTGRTVPEIWRVEGEAAFRAEEAAVLAEATRSAAPLVVSMGGGAVLDPANRALMKTSGLVVWLRVRVATLIARLGDGAGRPLLEGDPEAALTRLDTARRPIYESVAEMVIDVDGLLPGEVADRIVAGLVELRAASGDAHRRLLGGADVSASVD